MTLASRSSRPERVRDLLNRPKARRQYASTAGPWRKT